MFLVTVYAQWIKHAILFCSLIFFCLCVVETLVMLLKVIVVSRKLGGAVQVRNLLVSILFLDAAPGLQHLVNSAQDQVVPICHQKEHGDARKHSHNCEEISGAVAELPEHDDILDGLVQEVRLQCHAEHRVRDEEDDLIDGREATVLRLLGEGRPEVQEYRAYLAQQRDAANVGDSVASYKTADHGRQRDDMVPPVLHLLSVFILVHER